METNYDTQEAQINEEDKINITVVEIDELKLFEGCKEVKT